MQTPSPAPLRRQRYSPEFKARLVAGCHQSGMSISAVSLAHGINTNLLRKWVQESGAGVAWNGGQKPRRYPDGFKHEIVRQCGTPGVSATEIALQNGLSPKIVQAWVRQGRAGQPAIPLPAPPVAFLPVSVALPGQVPETPAPSSGAAAGQIDIELGAARVTVRGKADPNSLRVVLGALR